VSNNKDTHVLSRTKTGITCRLSRGELSVLRIYIIFLLIRTKLKQAYFRVGFVFVNKAEGNELNILLLFYFWHGIHFLDSPLLNFLPRHILAEMFTELFETLTNATQVCI
jgi:hypothetical protein